MELVWTDRHRADRQIDGIDFDELSYDPKLGHYCYHGEPFSGVSIQRYPDGELKSLVHYVGGLAQGVSVAWYPSGQIKLYTELEHEARHGLHIEWNEDGSTRAEESYSDGRRVRPPAQAGGPAHTE